MRVHGLCEDFLPVRGFSSDSPTKAFCEHFYFNGVQLSATASRQTSAVMYCDFGAVSEKVTAKVIWASS